MTKERGASCLMHRLRWSWQVSGNCEPCAKRRTRRSLCCASGWLFLRPTSHEALLEAYFPWGLFRPTSLDGLLQARPLRSSSGPLPSTPRERGGGVPRERECESACVHSSNMAVASQAWPVFLAIDNKWSESLPVQSSDASINIGSDGNRSTTSPVKGLGSRV